MFILGLERCVGCSYCIYIGQLTNACNSLSRGSWEPPSGLPWTLYSLHVLKYRQAYVIQNGKNNLKEFILSAVWIMSSELLKWAMEDLFEKMCLMLNEGWDGLTYCGSLRRGHSMLAWMWRLAVWWTLSWRNSVYRLCKCEVLDNVLWGYGESKVR